jgi:hypothetical protein
MTDPDVEEARQGEKLLSALRQALLRLHKTLLDWERSGYERIHGRQSSNDLLKALLNDPQFAWLRPMSQLIVRIDQILEEDTPPMRNDVDAVIAQVKTLTSPNESGNMYERRYDMALQQHPDAVFAHRDLLAVFKEDRTGKPAKSDN